MNNSNSSQLILTLDIEDWFTNGRSIKIDQWENYDLRVEKNVHKILLLLEEKQQKGTFFILGWLAEKLPQLVREIHNQGHEIASHGYAHELVYTQTPEIFREDARKSKYLLEDLIGLQVYGYRAPCFSITPWAIDILKEEGYMYDSSIAPNTFHSVHSKVEMSQNSGINMFEIRENFYEIMLPFYKLGVFNIPWGGGGYFRLYPYFIYQSGLRKLKNKNIPFTFYLHPYDIDFEQPRLRQYWCNKKIQRYYGLRSSYKKLSKVLENFSFMTAKEYYTLFVD